MNPQNTAESYGFPNIYGRHNRVKNPLSQCGLYETTLIGREGDKKADDMCHRLFYGVYGYIV